MKKKKGRLLLLLTSSGIGLLTGMKPGLKFEDREVEAIVLEVSSSSGYKEEPIRLRASYPIDTKKATLIHELGHRLQSDLFHQDEDDHKYLFLWVCEVWVKLFGREFTDAQVGEAARPNVSRRLGFCIVVYRGSARSEVEGNHRRSDASLMKKKRGRLLSPPQPLNRHA